MNEKRKPYEFTIPAHLRDKLRCEAERQGITLEELVNRIVQNHLASVKA
jgi:hypothetical protein